MVVGPLIGGGLSLVSALMGQGAQRDATNLGYLNLFEQQRQARRAEAAAREAGEERRDISQAAQEEQRRINDFLQQLQTATRGDALGNVIEYDEDQNAFETILTPLTEAILGGQQTEELAQFREDAPRNRQAAERMDRRSRMADEQFERLFNEYQYRPRGSEAESISDATQELLGARREGQRGASGDIATQLVRMGQSSALPAVAQEMSRGSSDDIAQAILQGRNIGRQRFREEEGGDVQRLLSELGGVGQLAGQTTTSPVGRVGTGEQLTGRADQALRDLTSVLASGGGDLARLMASEGGSVADLSGVIGQGAGRTGQATSQLANSISQGGLDLSGLARILAGMDFGIGGEEQRDPSAAYDPWAGLRQVTV